ncbi:MAG: DUF4271 domain-containing protein [Saprospiraceae bacterium]|nr:DUF4271 domain-containing protein [Saprospiraceae bacterium]
MELRWMLVGLYLLLQTMVFAQSGNPFDLTPRLTEQQDTIVEENVPSGNPFDIIGKKAKKEEDKRSTETPIFKKPKEISVPVENAGSKGTFLFTLIVGMLVLAAIFMTLLREFIGKVYHAFLNDNLLNQLHREQGPIASFPFQMLYILTFVIMGIFLYLLLDHYHSLPYTSPWKNLFASIGMVAGVFIAKHIFLGFLAWLFPIEKEIRVYSFTIMVFNIMLGLVLIPFNVIIAYAPTEVVVVSIYIGLGILALIYLFRQLRSLFAASRYLAFHKLHFLLYLCAVEIAPVLVLIKMIMLASGANEH